MIRSGTVKPTLASRLSSPINTTQKPRERVHTVRKTFSVGDQQYYIDLLIAVTQTLLM
jgi:hypothetical protein